MKHAMKRLCGAIFLLLLPAVGRGERDSVFLIFTSQDGRRQPVTEGIERSIDRDSLLLEYPCPVFTLLSEEKGYELSFYHDRYRTDTLEKVRKIDPEHDRMEMRKTPRSLLEQTVPIDLDALARTLSAREAWALGRLLKESRLWLIDRNDLWADSLLLIEAELGFSNEPPVKILVSPSDSINRLANDLRCEAMVKDSTYRNMLQKAYPGRPESFYDYAVYAETIGSPVFRQLPREKRRAIQRMLRFYGPDR